MIDTTTDKAVDGVLQRIDVLAAKLGTTASHIWDVYVAQARVEAVRDIVMLVVFGILLLWPGRLLMSFCYKKSEDDDWGIGLFFTVVGLLVLLIAVLSCGYDAMGELMNPQYWAFQNLMHDIKGLL